MTTLDAFLGGRLALQQPARGVRAGSDAVLLAAAVPARPGECILEAGCGAGAAMLCLAARVPGARILGLELQTDLARLAAANIRRNGLANRAAVAVGDLLAAPLAPDSFERAFANPPFFTAGRHQPAPGAGRALARAELAGSQLAGWIGALLDLLRPGGTLTLIQRAERLAEVEAGLAGRAGALVVRPLLPRAGAAPKRVLVQATKGAPAGRELRAGLVLHRADGGYSDAAEAVLRHGAALPL